MARARQGNPGRTSSERLVRALFVVGLLISGLMVARSQVTEDQLNLLSRGWLFAFEGEWVWHGVPASAGGQHPGGLMSLTTGLPLLLWQDHRAATLLVLISHVLAFFFLDRTLQDVLDPRQRVLFAALYWLNPWRLFHSGFLWNPNFLFLCGALHLATAYRLRRRPSFLWTFAHLLVLGVAVQFHMSALLLVAATAVLWWRRYVRLDLAGAAVAGVAVSITLAPWLLLILEEPSLRPVSDGGGPPVVERFGMAWRGILQWVRFPALSLSRSMACLDFTASGGPGNAVVGVWARGGRAALAVPTIAVALWANWRLLSDRQSAWRPFDARATDREWLRGVVRWTLVAAVVVFCAAPIGLSSHNVLVLFHVALLPVLFALSPLLDARSPALVARAIAGYVALTVSLSLLLAFGSPPYRAGGPICESQHFRVSPVVAYHSMFDDLGIDATHPVVVGGAGGFWPDALPRPEAGDGGLWVDPSVALLGAQFQPVDLLEPADDR